MRNIFPAQLKQKEQSWHVNTIPTSTTLETILWLFESYSFLSSQSKINLNRDYITHKPKRWITSICSPSVPDALCPCLTNRRCSSSGMPSSPFFWFTFLNKLKQFFFLSLCAAHFLSYPPLSLYISRTNMFTHCTCSHAQNLSLVTTNIWI